LQTDTRSRDCETVLSIGYCCHCIGINRWSRVSEWRQRTAVQTAGAVHISVR